MNKASGLVWSAGALVKSLRYSYKNLVGCSPLAAGTKADDPG